MRVSPEKHVVAVLRLSLGLHQQELADLAGCSRELIQSVELKRAKLTPDLALRISEATGVNLAWLMGNDLKAPPIATSGNPYMRYHFENAQQLKVAPLSYDLIEKTPDYLFGSYMALRGVLASAGKKGEREWLRAFRDLGRAIETLRKKYGTVAVFDDGRTGPSFSSSALPTIEQDVLAARQHFIDQAIELDPTPTPESTEAYKAFRQQHEFPARKPVKVRPAAKSPGDRRTLRERAVAETNAQLERDGLIKPRRQEQVVGIRKRSARG